MKISAGTGKLIDEINDFADKPIVNKYEVSVLIESTFLPDKKLFKELIFNAKYVNGLKKVISGRSINKDDYMEKLFAEFNNAVGNYISSLRKAVLISGDANVKFFEDKYLNLTQESMADAMRLADDLAVVKEYFNTLPKDTVDGS
ncbi:MAG: hypothetical protein ABI462_09810 [Ignavibacteria bacterium]